MNLADVKREALAMMRSLRKSDGTYEVNDALLESMIGAAYTAGQMSGLEAGYESFNKAIDEVAARRAEVKAMEVGA